MTEIIDIHPHILAADTERYPFAPVGGTLSGWAQSRPIAADDLLEQMDRAGISKAAVVQASTAYGYDNSYVLDSATQHPDRFVAVCCIDPLAADAAQRVQQGAETPGFAGIRLFTTGSTLPGQSDWLNDPATDPFWKAAEATGLPVCVQMRVPAMPQLLDVVERFPALTVVLDHMSYPTIAAGAERAGFDEIAPLAKFAGVVLKFTMRNTIPLTAAGVDASAFVTPLLDAFSADRIAWGSNFPAAEQSLPALVDLAERALGGVSAFDRAAILSGTARRLYPALA